MKKRWICLLVENDIGALARIAGLFSGKSYNLDSLTAGPTEDETVSRMTISLTSDDKTFEQVKKQLNRSVEVIKVIDYTEIPIHSKELMYIKISNCTNKDMTEVFRIAQVYDMKVIEYNPSCALLECVQTDRRNDDLIKLLQKCFVNRIEVVRGGSVAIEAINLS